MLSDVNSSRIPTETTPALKEWAIAVDALSTGETILLLRKGGIRELHGRFSVEHTRVLLYPTYEHQRPHWLKPTYASRIDPASSGNPSGMVALKSWADITHIFQIREPDTLAALLPFHIWNEQFAIERFNWKPRQPLYVLLLRTYSLSPNLTLPYRDEYGGCKSWIQLPLSSSSLISTASVLTDRTYASRVAEVQRIIES